MTSSEMWADPSNEDRLFIQEACPQSRLHACRFLRGKTPQRLREPPFPQMAQKLKGRAPTPTDRTGMGGRRFESSLDHKGPIV